MIAIRPNLRIHSDNRLQWLIQTKMPKTWVTKRYCRTKGGLLMALSGHPFKCTQVELEPIQGLPEYHPDTRKPAELENADD